MAEKKRPKRLGGYGEMNNPGLLSFAPGLQGFPQGQVQDNIPPSSSGDRQLLNQNSEYGPYMTGYQNENRPSDVLNFQQPQPYNQSINAQIEGGSQGFDKSLRMEPGALARPEVGKYAPMRPQDRQELEQLASPGLNLQDFQGAAAQGGLNVADALGQGARDTGKYGMNLLNAALYGKDSDRTLGQDLKKGGGFLQKLLFGNKPTPEAQGQENLNNFQMTPEQEAMREQGLTDNPWLADEDSENWWEKQEFTEGPDRSFGGGYVKGIGGLMKEGSKYFNYGRRK